MHLLKLNHRILETDKSGLIGSYTNRVHSSHSFGRKLLYIYIIYILGCGGAVFGVCFSSVSFLHRFSSCSLSATECLIYTSVRSSAITIHKNVLYPHAKWTSRTHAHTLILAGPESSALLTPPKVEVRETTDQSNMYSNHFPLLKHVLVNIILTSGLTLQNSCDVNRSFYLNPSEFLTAAVECPVQQ